MNIDYNDTKHLGNQIQALIESYKEFAEEDILSIIRVAPEKKLRLQEEVIVDTWNRVYPFTVKSLMLVNNNLMIVGEYYNKQDVCEFFSYINNFAQMKRIVDQILP